ncbi:MAG: YIP1 family protein [Paracoccaceae bacterium]
MSVTKDIIASYRAPRRVLARLQAMGAREDRLLAFLMGGCVMMFVANLPAISREAHLTGADQNMMMGAALLGLVFILPLILYCLSWVVHLILRAVTGQGDGPLSRLALFWALLAASPLILLRGLVAGFIGPGPGLNVVEFLWFAFFMWFWTSGLIQFYRKSPA